MSYEHIEVNFENGLGTITLNRPPTNILNIDMMEEINSTLDSWQGNKDLKVILFNAKGKCFSTGVDVGEHVGDLASKMIEVFHGMFRRMDNLGVLTIASVFDSCLGGGCELAVFCDMVVASEGAKFGQPEVQVGVFPPVAVQIMPRIIGRKAATELILSGKIISADESFNLGLINKVVKEEDLEPETVEFVKPFLNMSSKVLRVTKKAITAGLKDDLEPSLKLIEEIYIDELMSSHDAHEGLKAFLEKRKPEWRNE
jgi:cyclohexa-1,5-dienecarbonyl-CoA hydratase